jgi:tetratricopeptide (TPR) repeat protein
MTGLGYASGQRAAESIPPPKAPELTKELSAAMNADLVKARAATKAHQYADAEALMLKDSAAMPRSSLIWLELGFAQLGLKKYEQAEVALETALGIDTGTQNAIRRDNYYSPTDEGVVHASGNLVPHTVVSTPNLPPEVAGAAYSSLAEVYARTKRVAEAQNAWDTAAKVDPTHAALHLGNAAIIFNQVGASDAQVMAAEKAIAVDPNRAILYYFKGQGLAAKATVDPGTQKLVLPPGCAEAYEKYLSLDPTGTFSGEAKEVLTAAGQKIPSSYKAGKKA